MSKCFCKEIETDKILTAVNGKKIKRYGLLTGEESVKYSYSRNCGFVGAINGIPLFLLEGGRQNDDLQRFPCAYGT